MVRGGQDRTATFCGKNQLDLKNRAMREGEVIYKWDSTNEFLGGDGVS